MSTDFRPLADALRAELAKPFAEEDVMTDDEQAREVVAKALFFENYKKVSALDRTETPRLWKSYLAFMECEGYEPQDYFERATAAIAAYNAYLRERSKEPDVVEAAAGVIERYPSPHGGTQQDYAQAALTAALDAILGKENDDDR